MNQTEPLVVTIAEFGLVCPDPVVKITCQSNATSHAVRPCEHGVVELVFAVRTHGQRNQERTAKRNILRFAISVDDYELNNDVMLA
jgi:hypothetical protein